MPFSLQIDLPFEAALEPELLERALATTFNLLERNQDALVSLVITDAEQVQALNRDYRGIDAATDVLSFENKPDPDFPDTFQDPSYLGDIIIAYPVAERQAKIAGYPSADEIILLAVHGLLHLLGYDHDTTEGKAEMWAVQSEIMTSLGLAHTRPTEI